MLLLANQLPIRIEILDADDKSISQVPAILHQLDGERAIVTLDPNCPVTGFFWGARVRLRMEDGGQGYEVLGTVLEHNFRMTSPLATEEEGNTQNPPAIRLRLWDCRSTPEQRLLPRRRVRFAMHYRPMATPGETRPSQNEEENWHRGWCVDVGGGGLRLRAPRIPQLEKLPKKITLRFALPGQENQGISTPVVRFCLPARVLRADIVGRQADTVEFAVRFERLTVEEGLALSGFLNAE